MSYDHSYSNAIYAVKLGLIKEDQVMEYVNKELQGDNSMLNKLFAKAKNKSKMENILAKEVSKLNNELSLKDANFYIKKLEDLQSKTKVMLSEAKYIKENLEILNRNAVSF